MKNLPHLEELNDIKQVPLPYQKRTCTDIFCIFVGCSLALVFLILAIGLFNFGNFYKANFPSDSEGRLCGIDEQTSAYPYVYFVEPPSIARRVCVSECPKEGDKKLKCKSTKGIGCSFSNATQFQVIYYQAQPTSTRSGFFCLPTSELLRQQLMRQSGLQYRDKFYKSLDTIYLSFYVSFAFLIAYLVAVQFIPHKMVYIVIILGALIILTCIICILVYPGLILVKIIEIILLIIFLVIIQSAIIKRRNSMNLYGIFLEQSTKLIRQRPTILAYIPIFFVILVIFVILTVFQFTAFWTSGNLSYDPEKHIFYELEGAKPVFLSILLIFQTIWGFSFIKTAFNFCVSTVAVGWYYGQHVSICYPLKLLLGKHLGSVIGGSFITGFFSLFDYILDFLQPDVQKDTRYNRCYHDHCKRIFSIFDLVREDAICYVVLTSNPICNSSRFCQYLCKQTVISDQSQSISRSYRITAHLLLVGIMIIFGLYAKGNIAITTLLIIGLLALISSSLFISLHCDIAEAIQIILLADEELSRRARNVQYLQHDQEAVVQSLKGISMHPELVNKLTEARLKHLRQKKQKLNSSLKNSQQGDVRPGSKQ